MMANTRLSDEYNKATLIIAKHFLKHGIDVTLEREDTSMTDEPAVFDGNHVKLNNNLFVLTHASRDYPTKNYAISLNSIVPDYGFVPINEWELNIENVDSLKETENKIHEISENIIEVREYALDDVNYNQIRSSVKLISNANKLENRDPAESKEEEQER